MEVSDLVKSYGAVKAVQGISFQVRKNTCFGLLGPNGAGKTTTIEMMEGILRPDAGKVLFEGSPVGQHFKEKVGIQFQFTAIQEYITVRETLSMFSRLYNTHRDIDEVIELCSLADIIERDTRKLSGGQRQRMLLAIAIVNDPEIVFLDEPTTGLDPQARRNFWSLINKIKEENKTIVLTTHYMEEAQILCDEIAIMDHGHMLVQDTPAALLNEHFPGSCVSVPHEGDDLSAFPGDAVKVNSHVEFFTDNVDTAIHKLLHGNVNLEGLQIKKPNLEDLFLKLTGTNLRE